MTIDEAEEIVSDMEAKLWCRLGIGYVNVRQYDSSHILQAQIFLGNEKFSHKHNRKLVRKSYGTLESTYLKWKKQITADGIKCVSA